MRDSVRSLTPRRLGGLGGIAAVELAVRGVGGTTLADVVELFAEGVLLSLAIGLSSGQVGGVLSAGANWALYAYALYTFLPRLFPESLSGLADDRVLVGSVSVAAVLVALPVQGMLGVARRAATTAGPTAGAGGGTVQVLFLLLLLVSGLVWLYLRFGREEGILEPGSDTRTLLDNMGNDRVDERLAKPPAERSVVDRIELGLGSFVPALTFGFLVVMLGCLVAVLSLLYPIPELLFATVAVASPVLGRFDLSLSAGADLEEDISAALVSVLRSEKGHGIAVTTLLGVALSAFVFFAALFVGRRAADPFLATLRTALAEGVAGHQLRLAGTFAGVGAAVSLAVAAALLLWVWVRLARRSRAFTTAWDAKWGDGEAIPPTVARPPGAVLLPGALALAAMPVVFVTDWARPAVAVYGVAWPLGPLVAGLWVWYTFVREPQPALSDNWAYPVSLGAEFGLLVALGTFAPVSVAEFGGLAVVLLSFVLLLHFDPEVERRLERAGGRWERLSGGRVVLFAVPLVLVGVVRPQYATLAFLTVLITVVLGAVSVVDEYRSADGGH